MGFLNKYFGSSIGAITEKKDSPLPWIPLIGAEQLSDIVAKSKIRPQVIFKHSTRCGISSMVMNQFVDAYNVKEDALDLYYLDLISYRELSNEVANKFQVVHESPQLLVVVDGAVVDHESHGQILELDFGRFVE
ncbi:bacillithiol system redox-active protein YtxJ [Aestuariivivens insulae]|uniref:bacillithiol system redox-active protein YtxJ n=1 Tax=Aestuariivivens insulae TaxID=1621988 RepID=UPI001F596D3C|nr:bacillithiol system redox-active protein YtxJ [Aestuariivivens insulae]